MKKKADPRHIARRELLQKLFELGFEKSEHAYDEQIARIAPFLSRIDSVISQCAPQWPLSQINRVDLAVLRLAMYELFFAVEVPSKVVIDEAVELSKEFGSDASSSFINGVLGNVMDNFDAYKKEVTLKKDSAT